MDRARRGLRGRGDRDLEPGDDPRLSARRSDLRLRRRRAVELDACDRRHQRRLRRGHRRTGGGGAAQRRRAQRRGDFAARVAGAGCPAFPRAAPDWSGRRSKTEAERLVLLPQALAGLTGATLCQPTDRRPRVRAPLRAVGSRSPTCRRAGVLAVGDRARAQLAATHPRRSRRRGAGDDRHARRLRRLARSTSWRPCSSTAELIVLPTLVIGLVVPPPATPAGSRSRPSPRRRRPALHVRLPSPAARR